ncbi:hypothetical protein EXIGLDRAFT_774409 [Exidia glandulosa HHB12029]|uniref:BHLH domain-containing protein n=1 Tax=Exidia glandulosa HHB12029 TaxID=1314781 RepID=A0A165ED71_EXIGL|nr:hypothetical protein EXIGLDRAFT_774409 [Exidia glandulosa HHB12029]
MSTESIEDILAGAHEEVPSSLQTATIDSNSNERTSTNLDFLHLPLPDSPTMSLYDFETDWSQLLWSDHSAIPAAASWAMDMDIDSQLGAFIDAASVFSPPATAAQDVFHETSHQQPVQVSTATPQELAGLAQLLDAFPFTFDAAGYPVMQQQQQALPLQHCLTPSPSLEQSDSSATASDEIARLARESAGVVQAVIAGSPPPDHATTMSIPRTGRAIPQQQPSPSSSASSSVSASPLPITPLNAVPVQSAGAQQLVTGARPKTSHTATEQKYRKGLEARIIALRTAIPATRILDANPEPPCYADERGYVDGVKAVRRGSKVTKGIVLAKAVEYISVLKRREVRLRRENDGLCALVSSLVGGAQLLAHWEHSWVEKFGRAEDDVVEAGDNGSDDDESDEEDARPAKKARKSARAPAPQIAAASRRKATIDPQTGEKRKRGRPRKNQAPVAAVVVPPHMQQQQAPTQYLLAVFALFSLWNNASASSLSSSPFTHTGSVLADAVEGTQLPTWGWGYAVQAIHVVLSVVILISILYSVIRRRLNSYTAPSEASALVTVDDASDSDADLSASIASAASSTGPSTPVLEVSGDFTSIASSSDNGEGALSMKGKRTFSCKYPREGLEAAPKTLASEPLAHALGASGTTGALLMSGLGYALSSVRLTKRKVDADSAELEAWVQLADALVVEGEDAPLTQRFQTYFTLGAARPRSASHRAALALLSHSLGMADAETQWNAIEPETAAERVVLRHTLESAHDQLMFLPPGAEQCHEGSVKKLARDWLRLEVQAMAREAFMCIARGMAPDPERIEELRAVGAELGGRESRLALAVAGSIPISSSPSLSVFDASELDLGEGETEDIVRALGLFRCAFPVAFHAAGRMPEAETEEGAEEQEQKMLLSPLPSPAPRNARAMLVLQQVLGSQTFDEPALEDARDRMVDMVRAAGLTLMVQRRSSRSTSPRLDDTSQIPERTADPQTLVRIDSSLLHVAPTALSDMCGPGYFDPRFTFKLTALPRLLSPLPPPGTTRADGHHDCVPHCACTMHRMHLSRHVSDHRTFLAQLLAHAYTPHTRLDPLAPSPLASQHLRLHADMAVYAADVDHRW